MQKCHCLCGSKVICPSLNSTVARLSVKLASVYCLVIVACLNALQSSGLLRLNLVQDQTLVLNFGLNFGFSGQWIGLMRPIRSSSLV